jgi:hypothetical protein
MAFGQDGEGVAVGAGTGVAVDLLAMIAWTSATAVRRTIVACAPGEPGDGSTGAEQARLATTSPSNTAEAATQRRSIAA